MKTQQKMLGLAAAVLLAACAPSQPAETDAARAPGAPVERVRVSPEAKPVAVTVTAVGRDGKPTGDARVVRLTAETGDPKDLGLVPVPAGSK